jgi:hypothetical protein
MVVVSFPLIAQPHSSPLSALVQAGLVNFIPQVMPFHFCPQDRTWDWSTRMPYRLTYERRVGYLHVRMEGEESFEEAVRFWQALSDISIAEGITRFLIIDTVVGRLNTFQHFEISKLVASLFLGKRIAYVDPKEETFDANSFGETVIQNRGGIAKVFRLEDDARQWLLANLAPEGEPSRR